MELPIPVRKLPGFSLNAKSPARCCFCCKYLKELVLLSLRFRGMASNDGLNVVF